MKAKIRVKVACTTCGADVLKPPYLVREHNFCGKTCRLIWFGALNQGRRNRVTRVCECGCGREFEIPMAWIKKGGGRFYNKECADRAHSVRMKGFSQWKRMTPEQRVATVRKQKLVKTGKLNPMYGRTQSPKTKAAIGQKSRQRMADPQYVRAALRSLRIKPNKAERHLEAILQELYPGNWKFVGDGEVILDGLNPDFINCNGKKLLIELFGEHWHKDTEGRKSEAGRRQVFGSFGYRTLVIWERELASKEAVITKIKGFYEEVHAE